MIAPAASRVSSPAAALQRDRRPARRRPRAGPPGARGRHGLPRDLVRCARRRRRRPRRQHEPDRLPGGLHRPLVRRPARRHDLSADRQLRPAARRRPVGPAVAARPDRRQRHGRGRRAGRPARGAPARTGHPGDRRRGHARAGPAPADGRLGSRPHRRPGRARSRPRPSRRARARPALGGPGLRRRGLAGRAVRRRRPVRRRPARRHRGPRAQEQHRPQPAPARRAGPRAAPHRDDRGGAGAGHRRASSSRPVPAIRPGSTTQVALARAAIDDGRPLLGICLGPPDRRPRGGRRDAPAAVRPSRCQPPDPRPRHGPGPGHGPEPRGDGRRRIAAGRAAASG